MSDAVPSCSFCGKTQHYVRLLIAGPSAHICDECVDICVSVIAEKETENETAGPGTSSPPQIDAACAICDAAVPMEASLLVRDRSRICPECASDVVNQTTL